MFFWIFLAIILILWGLFIALDVSADLDGASIMGFLPVLLFVGIYSAAATSATNEPGAPVLSETVNEYSLEAIGTSSAENEFFVLAGEAPGDGRTLSFIAPDNGTQFLAGAPAVDSDIRIVDEGTEPTVIITTYVFHNPVWVPWTTGGYTTYEFFVPASGVLEDYAVGK